MRLENGNLNIYYLSASRQNKFYLNFHRYLLTGMILFCLDIILEIRWAIIGPVISEYTTFYVYIVMILNISSTVCKLFSFINMFILYKILDEIEIYNVKIKTGNKVKEVKAIDISDLELNKKEVENMSNVITVPKSEEN